MDILYSIQNIRLGCPDWIISIIILLSDSVLIVAPLLPFCTYWSVNKKKGTYMLCALAVAYVLNELLKVTFCVYRPWILDDRLTPVAQALNTATNYSFPSSHSCMAAVVGTSNVLAFPKNKTKAVITALVVLLIMFSRVFLGCHSLLDVCIGGAIGLCVAFILSPMLKDSFDEEKFTKWVLPVTLAVTVIAIVYILNKNYPLDYDAEGNLIVDSSNMWPDVIGSCGLFAGVGIGLFLERKFVVFSNSESRKWSILRCVGGLVVFALLYLVIIKKLLSGIDPAAYRFLRYFICSVLLIAAYPILFKLRTHNT